MTGNTNLEGEQINDVKGRLDDIASLFSAPTQVNYSGTYPSIAAGAEYQFVINIAKAGKKPIAFCGYGVVASGTEKWTLVKVSMDSTKAYITVRNDYSSAKTPYMAFAMVTYIDT